MLNQDRVRSGYDIEILLGARQLSYLLLSKVDAGEITGQPDKVLFLPRRIDRTYLPSGGGDVSSNAASDQAFEVEFLFDAPDQGDLKVRLNVAGQQFQLFVKLTLFKTLAADGLLTEAKLSLQLVDARTYNPDLPTDPGQRIDDLQFAELSLSINKELPLDGLAASKRIHDLNWLKFPADSEHAAAYGIYVNLRLQQGPDPQDLLAARGQLSEAMNFLPSGSDMAMACRPGLFDDFATDLYERCAEKNDSGGYDHVWRDTFYDKSTASVGKVLGVKVAPKRHVDSVTGETIVDPSTLRIRIDLDYWDEWYLPTLHVTVDMTPSINDQGIMVWKYEVNYGTSVYGEVLAFALLTAVSGGLLGIAGLGLLPVVGYGLLSGSLADALGHTVAAVALDATVSVDIQAQIDASLPDVLSGRISVSERRWDPFYATFHDVAMRPDGGVVNDAGIAIWGRAALDKWVRPVSHVVPRDPLCPHNEAPTHLLYRVNDAAEFHQQFRDEAPGSDRLFFEQPDPSQPTLVRLSIEDIQARMKDHRLLSSIRMKAKKIEVKKGTVTSILAISELEISETRGRLITAFLQRERERLNGERGVELRNDALMEFAAEGHDPTLEEINDRVNAKLAALLVPLQQAYEEGSLPSDLETALDPLLNFDLSPKFMAGLQLGKILQLPGLVIVRKHSDRPYYRDQADIHVEDNLKSLPHYDASAS